MHLSTYLLLVGAAVLVTRFSGTDSFVIGRPSSGKVEESGETDNESAAVNRTSAEDSAEEDAVQDSSEEEEDSKVKRSAQFARNSDEFDNFSFELDRRPVGPVRQSGGAQATPAQSATMRNPVSRNSDERFDASDEVRAVLASPVRQAVPTRTAFANSDRLPLVPMSFRNPILARQPDDFDDDLSVEIRDRIAATPVIQQAVSTSTVTSAGRLPVPIGFRNQLVRESDGDLSLELVRVAQNQQTVPAQTSTQSAGIRTAVFGQSDERDDIDSVEIFGSLIQNGQLPTAPPAQTSAIRPIQQANSRQQPIQTVNQAGNVSARPVTARPQVQPPNPTRPTAASSGRLPLVPMSFRNAIPARQSDDFDDDISIEIRDRVAPATPVVQQVVSTQAAISDRLPVPLSFRNPVLRPSDEFDDISDEIRGGNIFAAPQQANRPAANGQAGAPITASRPEFIVTRDSDGDVSLELVGRVLPAQPAGFSVSPVRPLVAPQPVAAGSFVQTGVDQGQQRVNVFDDYSLEDNDDDNDFFLEDQFDNVDGFRLLASDFFAQPAGNGLPSVRSVGSERETGQKGTPDQLEDRLTEPVSLDASDFHAPAESDDWFLVKQYMDHDYSSEELEGELAREYFWQPVKDAKKVKTEQDKMAELKPARSF